MKLPTVLPAILAASVAAVAAPALKVSDNHRFLVTTDGRPFFWLGDTAWELFHRLTREEAVTYLDDRRKKGFTVIQAVALAEFDGLEKPNAYGFRPLIDHDPTRPDVKDGPQNDYWDQVDFIVDQANARGLTIGFLPTWGDKWNKKWGQGPEVFTPANAATYGKWIGLRYKDKDLVWILGGDRPTETDRHKEIIRAMALGLRQGDGGAHLITYHPTGGASSAEPFHNDPWLDFNMRQNGHGIEFGRYSLTRVDYDRQPIKPVLDGEPIYEGHPVNFNAREFGHSLAADVRHPLYWDLFTGAFGHTYGHHSVWQMASPKYDSVNSPLKPWTEAIDDPGAGQMQHGRRLIESRPYLTRVPDDSIIVTSVVPTDQPGAGTRRFVATRDTDGTYAMVYFPVSKGATVRMDCLHGPTVKAWWFNPRDGTATAAGEFPNTGSRTFSPPLPGEQTDWVLVLDDAAKNYPPPGAPQ